MAGDEGGHGDGVGDPAGSHGEGDIGFGADGENDGGDHLEGHGHHGKEEADGEAVSDRVAAGDPECAVGDGLGEEFPPFAIAEVGVAQGAEGKFDEFEVTALHGRVESENKGWSRRKKRRWRWICA